MSNSKSPAEGPAMHAYENRDGSEDSEKRDLTGSEDDQMFAEGAKQTSQPYELAAVLDSEFAGPDLDPSRAMGEARPEASAAKPSGPDCRSLSASSVGLLLRMGLSSASVALGEEDRAPEDYNTVKQRLSSNPLLQTLRVITAYEIQLELHEQAGHANNALCASLARDEDQGSLDSHLASEGIIKSADGTQAAGPAPSAGAGGHGQTSDDSQPPPLVLEGPAPPPHGQQDASDPQTFHIPSAASAEAEDVKLGIGQQAHNPSSLASMGADARQVVEVLRIRYEKEEQDLNPPITELKTHLTAVFKEHERFRFVSPQERALGMTNVNYSFQKIRIALKSIVCDLLDTARRYFSEKNSAEGRQNGFRRERRNFSKQAREILSEYFYSHLDNPYPSESQKAELASRCGITVCQVTNWFGNKRIRYKKNIGRPAKEMRRTFYHQKALLYEMQMNHQTQRGVGPASQPGPSPAQYGQAAEQPAHPMGPNKMATYSMSPMYAAPQSGAGHNHNAPPMGLMGPSGMMPAPPAGNGMQEGDYRMYQNMGYYSNQPPLQRMQNAPQYYGHMMYPAYASGPVSGQDRYQHPGQGVKIAPMEYEQDARPMVTLMHGMQGSTRDRFSALAGLPLNALPSQGAGRNMEGDGGHQGQYGEHMQ